MGGGVRLISVDAIDHSVSSSDHFVQNDDPIAEVVMPPPLTAEQRRGRRRIRAGSKPRVFNVRELAVEVARERVRTTLRYEKPKTRGECSGTSRPCPFVSCRHHLYLIVNEDTGSLTISFPDLEPWELKETCSLDVAEQKRGITLEEVGELTNLTRERIRQIEVSAARLMKRDGMLREIASDE